MSRFVAAALVLLLLAVPCLADGAALFKTKCAACHGENGAGATTMGKKLGIRDFGSADVQKQTDAQLVTIVKNGKNKMPAYSGKITDAEIATLVAHIRTFKK
jgi:cytochrome c6